MTSRGARYSVSPVLLFLGVVYFSKLSKPFLPTLPDGVSGMADAGQLVALMGASGAGKTTLLNTLLFRNLKGLNVQGQVLVNGHALGQAITYVSGVRLGDLGIHLRSLTSF